MADYLPVPTGGAFPARYERRLGRALSKELAAARAREEIACAKVTAIESTGHVAQAAVAALSLGERFYVEQAPHAAGRQKFIADEATLLIGDELRQLARRLR